MDDLQRMNLKLHAAIRDENERERLRLEEARLKRWGDWVKERKKYYGH